MGKGEIARYKQFLLFPQCFQMACFPGASKGVIVWEWVKKTMASHMMEWLSFKGRTIFLGKNKTQVTGSSFPTMSQLTFSWSYKGFS